MTIQKSSSSGLIAIVVTAMFFTTGCHQESQVVSLAPDPAPAKQKATAAFQDFSTKLKGELQAAIEAGGPVKAVEVCSVKAPQIAQELTEANGFPIGRSSHRLRNTHNEAPSEAVASYLRKYSDKPAKEAVVEVAKENGDWVVVAPIATQPLCLTCHGSPDTFSTELKEALSHYYPEDEATGFKAGDLRGVIWARLPQQKSRGMNESVPLEQSNRKIKTH